MSFCMICSASFADADDDDHKCPPKVKRRWEISMWTQTIQCTWNARGRGWGKKAAIKKAREALPNITEAQVASIGDGSVLWADIYGWFGFKPDESEIEAA